MTTNHLHYQKYTLAEELQKFIKYAWIMKSTGIQSSPDLLIPDGYSEIIFIKKGGYYKQFINPNQTSVTITKSCLVGIQTQSVLASRMDNSYLIGLKLKPMGAYFLLKNHLENISDSNQYLEDLDIKWLIDLNQNLQKCSIEVDMIQCLEETLLHQTKNLKGDKNTSSNTFLETILRVNGQISVQEIAQVYHLSVRQFQRKFKVFFGISPKKFLNIIRFKHLYKSSILQKKLPADFLEYGYYDQMHFIKDFQKHLGINPSKSAENVFLEMNKMAQRNI